MSTPRITDVLKRDSLGRVERLEADGRAFVRRVAAGGRVPGSAWAARLLLRREERALVALQDLDGVPRRVVDDALLALPDGEGRPPGRGAALVRTWVEGAPLHLAETLPEDFFDRLAELVASLHRRGVCHNDLHKEQNVMVGGDGYPALIDFQLASCHMRPGPLFRSRVQDDLRHVEKHRRRYTLHATGAEGAMPPPPAPRMRRRTWTSALWRRFVKPVYVLVTRRLMGWRDAEERRATAGPWPRWTPAVGPRAGGPREGAALGGGA